MQEQATTLSPNMNRRLSFAFVTFFLLVAASMSQEAPRTTSEASPAQEETPLSPDQKAIADQANAFIAAYNKGDAKAIAAMFSEDAKWVDDGGNILSGRDEIEGHFTAIFQDSKENTIDVDVESIRPLTPDVMVEMGTSTVTTAEGRHAISSYSAVHVKKGDAWLISQFTETGSPFEGNASRRLSALEWLVGTWQDSDPGISAKSTISWALDGNYLTWTYSFTPEDGEETNGTEVIGWDPTIDKIRSWVFEGDGGFTEKLWTQDGRRWLIQGRSVLPDGGQGTEEQTLTFVDKDTFTWSAASRQVDGEALPNIEKVTAVRAKN
jgi:uncharacterized protein (TIGR02246 family)